MERPLLGRLTWRMVTLVACEHVLIVLALMAAAYLRFDWLGSTSVDVRAVLPKAILVAVVLQVCLQHCDLYDLRVLADHRELTARLLQAMGSASLILAFLYYWLPDLVIGRGVVLIAAALLLVLVAGWRFLFQRLSLAAAPAERLLIVGTNAAAVELARELYDRKSELGVDIVGFVDPEPTKVGTSLFNPGVIGTVADIPALLRQHRVDRIVLSLSDARGKLPVHDLLALKLTEGIRFDHLASVYEQYTGKIAVENLRPSWLLFASGFRSGSFWTMTKRGGDVLLASLGLLVASPAIGLVALGVRLTSPGPVIYRQRRVGHHGKVFTLYKFRSMREDAEAESGPVWARTNDARVTPFGRFLRRTRLDELPQLFNVLRGEMSLVGPRPERPEFVEQLTRQIPFYGQRHVVRPGVTGWAQVRYPYGASVEDALEKLQFDLFYIKNVSLALDSYVLLETLKTVLMRRGS